MRHVRLMVLTLLTGALLAACGGKPPEPPVNPARELSGTVQNWSGGSATLQAVTTGDNGEITGDIGATGTLAADGSFALTLPETPNAAALSDSSITAVCTGAFDGTATPDAWQEAFADLAVQQNGGTRGFLTLASSEAAADFQGAAVGDFIVTQIYVSKDVTIQGTCTSEFGNFDTDVQLEQGWNLMVFTIKAIDPQSGFPSQFNSVSPEAVPNGAKWYFAERGMPASELGTQSVGR